MLLNKLSIFSMQQIGGLNEIVPLSPLKFVFLFLSLDKIRDYRNNSSISERNNRILVLK